MARNPLDNDFCRFHLVALANGFKVIAFLDIYKLMIEKFRARLPTPPPEWLVAAGLLTLFLAVTRCLFWLYGFPEGMVKILVTLAAFGIVAVAVLSASKLFPNASLSPQYWTIFEEMRRRDVVVACLISGWLLGIFIEAWGRIDEPVFSLVLTIDDVIDLSIISSIIAAFLAFINLMLRTSGQRKGDT